MITLLNYITLDLRKAPKLANIEDAATRDLHIATGHKFLEDQVMSLQKDPKTLALFSTYLRMADGEGKSSYELLYG